MGFIFIFLLMGLTSAQAWSQCEDSHSVPGEFIIRLQNTAGFSDGSLAQKSLAEVNSINFLNTLGASTKLIFSSPVVQAKIFAKATQEGAPASVVLAKVSPDKSSAFFDQASKDSRVLSIEKNCLNYVTYVPNDSLLDQQKSLQVIHAQEAWDITKGSPQVVVAVSDTGVDYNHEDLHDNMWINTKEIPANGIDDDGNGCVDDIYGCDFGDGDGDPKPGSTSMAFHGTHVAGIIAAKGNNAMGVAGIAFQSKIMAVKGFKDASDTGDTASLVQTLYYAVKMGAKIINCSWTGERYPSYAETDAAKYVLSHGVVPVVAAGNSTADASRFSPAGIADVVTVGSVNSLDQLSTFSNFGNLIDIIAPGGDLFKNGAGMNESILSTHGPINKYVGLQGTSMASPHVAAVAALIFSVRPTLSAYDVIDILKKSGDMIEVRAANAAQTPFTYPRLNALKAVQLAQTYSSGPTPTPSPNPDLPSNCVGDPDFCKSSSSLSNSAPTAKMGGCSMGGNSSQNTAQAAAASSAILILPLGLLLILRRGATKTNASAFNLKITEAFYKFFKIKKF